VIRSNWPLDEACRFIRTTGKLELPCHGLERRGQWPDVGTVPSADVKTTTISCRPITRSSTSDLMRTCFTLAIVLFPAIAAAQSSSLFPSSGGSSSSRSTGGSTGGSFGSSTGSGGGTAASSMQQSLGGGGGGGLSGSSGATFGEGTLQEPQFTQFGQAGTAVLDGGFVGLNETGTFVGVDATTGQGTQQGQQGLSGLGNRGQQQGQSQGRSTAGSGRSRTQRLQPVVRIAFEFEPRTVTGVQNQLAESLSAVNMGVEGLVFDLDADGVLTMTGIAATEDDRRLAESYVRLEPGVRRVENLIVVAP
jgi:hypothetical protein